jgi:two-component system sensor kinase FixL
MPLVRALGADAETRILAAFFDSTEDAIFIRDETGRIVRWNPGAERMFGYSAAEITGQAISALVPADRADEYAEMMRRVMAGERVDALETVRVARDGTRLDVSLSVWPIRDGEGRTVGAAVTARNMTAQRRAERAQRDSQAQWRAIIESAVDGIVMIDRRGRIEFFNPAAERLFGYQEADVIGRNVSILMPPEYAAEHDAYLERYQRTREPHVIGIGRDVTGRRKDGSTFPLHLSVGELSLGGETKFTGIVRDLTDRVKLELKLREESGLVRVGAFAAVLAHEVKNPLAAVGGAIQMLSARMNAEDKEIAQEILGRLDALSALMGDLLLFARPPRPQMRLVEVSSLLDALVAFMKSDPQWLELDVVVEGQAGRLLADPELLKMAFQNLLLNAAQAVRGKGLVRVRLSGAEGRAFIDIIDSGPGIPAELRESIFTPFFTTKARGTGLGLPTVRRIADAHGGQVDILESSSAGTTVRVSLPAAGTGRP